MLLVRSGCPVRFPQLCALALWLVVPFSLLAASASLLSHIPTERWRSDAIAMAGFMPLVFLPPVLLIVWVAAALSLRLRRRSV